MKSVAASPPFAFYQAYCGPRIFSENHVLKFALSRDQCLQMIREVLRDLDAHAREFGDKILCILREGQATYAFELNVESITTNYTAVYLDNFKIVHSFAELIDMRLQLSAWSEQGPRPN